MAEAYMPSHSENSTLSADAIAIFLKFSKMVLLGFN
jgi:hypothetical protein